MNKEDADKLFEYLVATDQVDDFMGLKKDQEEEILEEHEEEVDDLDELDEDEKVF